MISIKEKYGWHLKSNRCFSRKWEIRRTRCRRKSNESWIVWFQISFISKPTGTSGHYWCKDVCCQSAHNWREGVSTKLEKRTQLFLTENVMGVIVKWSVQGYLSKYDVLIIFWIFFCQCNMCGKAIFENETNQNLPKEQTRKGKTRTVSLYWKGVARRRIWW